VNLFRLEIAARSYEPVKALPEAVVEEPNALEAYITKLSQDGGIQISFSEDIFVVPNLAMITNGTVEIDKVEQRVILIEIDPGEDSDPAYLLFDWEAIAQTKRTIDLQLTYDSGEYISSNPAKEWIKITFLDPVLFTSNEGLQIDKKKRTISRELPPQLPEKAKPIQEVIDTAVESAKVVVIVQAAITLLLSASLN